jgi:hypothetical protein
LLLRQRRQNRAAAAQATRPADPPRPGALSTGTPDPA